MKQLGRISNWPTAVKRKTSDGKYYEKRVDAKGCESEPVCIQDEIPFEIPESWEWCRLENIGETNIGLTYKPSNIKPSGTGILRSNNIKNGKLELSDVVYVDVEVPQKSMLQNGDILICARNGSRKLVGKAAIVDADGFGFGAFMAVFRSEYNPYIHLFIQSPTFRSQIDGAETTTINQITQAMLKAQLIPLPPSKEQLNIADAVRKVEPFISQYDDLETEREQLDAELPERLRKTILQMAAQGKLVPQDPNDEPASVLLERIREERRKLIADGKMKAPKGGESVIYRGSDGGYYEKRIDVKGNESVPVCIDDEIPFEIPGSWEWCRLGMLLQLVSDGVHKTPQYTTQGVPFLSIQNISSGVLDLTKIKYVSEKTHEELCKRIKPRKGDILLCRIGTLGRPYLVDFDMEFSIFVSLGLLRVLDSSTSQWIIQCLAAPLGDEWIQSVKVGGGTHTYKINLGDIPNFLMPIPPIAEQYRIALTLEQLKVTNQ